MFARAGDWVKRYWPELTLVGIVVAARIFFIGPFFDDGFIYFRYIENLFAGHGLVYNPGEYLSALTSPLWTLLLIIMRAPGIPLTIGAAVLGIAADCATAIFMRRILLHYNVARWLRFITLSVFVLDGFVANTTSSGLETSLYVCLLMAVFYLLLERPHSYWLVSTAALIPLVRLDGSLIVGLICAWFWFSGHRKTALKLFSISAIAVTVIALLNLAYYGSVLPHSISFKFAIENYHSHFNINSKLDAMFGFQIFRSFQDQNGKAPLSPIILYIILASLFGLIASTALRLADKTRLRAPFVLMAVWLACYGAFFAVSGAPVNYSWYFAVTHAIYITLTGIATSFYWQKIYSWVRVLALLIVLGLLSRDYFFSRMAFQRQANGNLDTLVRAGEVISQHVPPTARVGMGAAGMVAYYARNTNFLDLQGLTDERTLAFRKEHGLTFDENTDVGAQEAAVADAFKPEYVLTGYADSFIAHSKQRYKLVAVFQHLRVFEMIQ